MNKNTIASAFFVLLTLLFAGSLTPALAQSGKWATAYYAGWMQGYNNTGYMPAQNVDYSAVTHIVHFALVPNANGTLNDQSNGVTAFNANEVVTRAHAAGKKVIICIGGWSTDVAFRSATNSTNRSTFINNILNIVQSRGYDGVDIDWEPLASSDGAQYIAFIQDLRAALNTISPRPLLTAATAWGSAIFGQIHSQFDQINIMSYDLAGAWPGWVTWPNSPVSDGGFTFPSTGNPPPSADGMVDQFVAAGVPKSKIGIGIDFYGYIWSGGAGTAAGGATEPRQTWTTAPSVQANVPYYTIMQNHYQPQYYRFDNATSTSYLSIDNSGSSSDKFITYDDEETIRKKVEYTQTKGIGGVIIWELGGGYRPNMPAGQRDVLLQTVKAALGGSIPPPPVDVTPPTISLTAPLDGVTLTGIVGVTANASDNVGVVGVQFKVDGANVGSEDVSAPYSISLNTLQLLNGTRTISAVARDAAGNTATASVSVSILNISLDTTPPTVSLTSPANGSTVSGTVTLSANASDNVGVAGVQFKIDGADFGSEDASNPYSASLNTTQFANGTHSITATARDAAGNTASSSVTVTVSNTVTTPPPSGSDLMVYADALSSPWVNNSWSATATFNSTERAYAGTSSIKTVTSAAWGALSLHYGSWGAQGVNTAGYINLDFAAYAPSSGTAFSVFFENDNGQTFPKYSTGSLAANSWVVVSIPVSQLNPNAQTVNRVSIQEVSGSTKTFFIDNLRFTGSEVDTAPPTAAFTAPTNGATLSGTAAVTLNATDNKKVVGIQLKLDGSNLGAELTSSPYTYSLNTTTIANGSHTLTAVARDSAGNQASASVTVTVSNTTPPPPQSALAVYTESLQSPWINASWSATVTFESTEQAFAGTRSIKVAQNAWGALRLHSGPWGQPANVNTSNYQNFNFAIHGGTAGISLGVYFENDISGKFPSVKNVWIPANKWTQVSLPLGQLNPNNLVVHRIVIQDLTGRTKTFYLDNISFGATLQPLSELNDETLNGKAAIAAEMSFGLGQNYPNPFNPVTSISYRLPEVAEVKLEVFNSIGQLVETLVSGEQAPGEHQVKFGGAQLASGIYFYRLTARGLSGNADASFSETRKMFLMK